MRRWQKIDVTLENPIEDSPDYGDPMELTLNWIPGCAAIIYGAPEDCSPAESPEFEIVSGVYSDGRDVPDEVLSAIPDNLIFDLLEDHAWSHQ